MNILLTGYTGNLGPAIAAALAPHTVHAVVREIAAAPAMPQVALVEGSLESLPASLADEIEVIVHAAASTSFQAPLDELRHTNVEGTRRVLGFAGQCPHLRKLVHVSTACVCGLQGGDIPESRLPRPPGFVNAYEQSKWEAEELVLDAGLPAEIVRLSIVAGSESDGSVRRLGALHHTLYWLWKGLIPMMPGTPDTPVDLISTEFAAAVVSACALAPVSPGRIVQGCAGKAAPTLSELLDHLAGVFATISPSWQRGSITPPMIVDGETFALFEQTVEQSGDLLFRRVSQDSQAFLPGLLHPRGHATAHADALAGAQRPDWRNLAELVTRHVIDSRS